MCGRYGVQVSGEELVRLAQALIEADVALGDGVVSPWAEVRPTDVAPILLGRGRRLVVAGLRWGIRVTVPREGRGGAPEGLRETLVINARAETAATKRSFRAGTRALVPATGWLEWPAEDWQTPTGRGAARQPVALGPPDGRVVWFAGLCVPGVDSDAFVIVTRPPVPEIAPIHDRMPAIVDAEAARAWLSGEATPEALLDLPVTPAPVASAVGPAPARQLSLF
jgi:putative SOS response-associated peptidase YedK